MVNVSMRTVLVVASVVLLAYSIQGLPVNDDANLMTEQTFNTTTPAPGGIKGWIKGIKNKIHEHSKNCRHGGVIGWFKNKLGIKGTTAIPPYDSSTVYNNQPGYQPGTGLQPNSNQPESGFQPEMGYLPNSNQPDTGYLPNSNQPDTGYLPDSNQPDSGIYQPDINNPTQFENGNSSPDVINNENTDDFDLERPVSENVNEFPDYNPSTPSPNLGNGGEGIIEERFGKIK
ncbi:uncharacterized protein LOC126903301 isoform X2 [Daktulosphaira vitifoliae]|uniref:uncharacterized protein LOC126903301 isoform X2 n=1 Tax=Daktulosphaira vitifoliae TaxID=58002 RepID=UPI0021AA6FB4|nr:uncharacterized protein LOC126903301 isoform X2 [Daktulosphaira vitifoliae]